MRGHGHGQVSHYGLSAWNNARWLERREARGEVESCSFRVSGAVLPRVDVLQSFDAVQQRLSVVVHLWVLDFDCQEWRFSLQAAAKLSGGGGGAGEALG